MTACPISQSAAGLYRPHAVLWIIGLLTALRLIALYFSPLELGGDEAQYWAWSQHPAFGYYSKPPLIAWAIALTTALFGDAQWAVRLMAPLAHGATALLILLAGKTIGQASRAQSGASLAALIYILMPGVWFSSGIMTTDTLLLTAYSGALAAYFSLLNTPSLRAAIGLGLAVGLGFLAKYAMVYFCLGILVLLITDKGARRALLNRYGGLAAALATLILLPNLIWNHAHHFATFTHTAQNAGWKGVQMDWPGLLGFWGSQLGVFGPLALPLFFIALYWALRNPKAPAVARHLGVFALTPLVIISLEAIINRANANWAFSAYVPAALLLGLWIATYGRYRLAILAIALNVLIGSVLVAVVFSPSLAARLGVAGAFKRVQGWQETAQIVARLDTRAKMGPETVLVMDNRLFYYAVRYYGRQMDLPDMYIWPRFGRPHSHAELVHPLPPGLRAPMIIINRQEAQAQRLAADFENYTPLERFTVPLGGNKKRYFQVFTANRYTPLPRDENYELQWDDKAKP
ncbi:MAG: hypothetical protein COA84_05640 [Robiginitomaculum sp.]|nr:MAG: hypothetical protein COA84_05640 [Robiginitomaculum sp.]